MSGHRTGEMDVVSMTDEQIFVYTDRRLDGWVNRWTEVWNTRIVV